MMVREQTLGAKVFNGFNYAIMAAVIFATLYPFWYALIGSFNEGFDWLRGGIYLWPRTFTLQNYRAVFFQHGVVLAYGVTASRTVIGTASHLVVTLTFAYAFSRRDLVGKVGIGIFCLIPMFFQGGIIPRFLVYKNLGLIDNFLVYILPWLFNFWNVLVFQAYFRTIPDSVPESARMDGANEYLILWKLIIPISKPVVAAIILFQSVFHWNSYMDSLIYTTSEELQTIQLFLVRIIQVASDVAMRATSEFEEQWAQTISSRTVQLATMMVTTAPILLVYPFVQKHFVKGIMIGSIKG